MKRNSLKDIGILFLTIGIAVQVLALQGVAQSVVPNTVAQNSVARNMPSVVQWQTDINRAAAMAKESNRLLLIHFYGNNCPPCRAMDANVFTDSRVVDELNRNFVMVKTDTSQHAELAKKLQVSAIPTDIVLNDKGQVVSRRQGGITADRFCQYLTYLQTTVQHTGNLPTADVSKPTAPLPVAAVPQPTQQPNLQTTTQPAPQPNFMAANEIVTVSPSNPVPTPAQTSPPTITENNSLVLHDPFTKQPVQSVSQPVAVSASRPVIQATPTQQASPIQAPPIQAAQPFPIAGNEIQVPLPAFETASKPAFTESSGSRSNPVRFPEMSTTSPENTVAASSSGSISGAVPPGTSPAIECEAVSAPTVEIPLGLEGFCPVILGHEERWTPGNPAFYAMFRGQVYRFSSEEAMKVFVQNPLKYAPIAMGEDIVMMVQRNKKSYGSRKFGAWFEGRVYLFSCQDSLDAFAAKPEYYAEIAKKYETALKSSLDTVQR